MIDNIQIGDFTFATLLDGVFPCGPELIQAAASTEGEQLFLGAGLPPIGPSPEPINAFVLKRGNRLWLIDAGCGRQLGPDFGKTHAALEALGYKAEDVEAIVLTHLHEDHIGGLLTDDGAAAFPNARIIVVSEELAFWTDPTSPAKNPDEAQAKFDVVQSALKPYEGKIESVPADSAIEPGVRFVALFGHSPGHCGVLIEGGGQKLLMWGDIAHSTLLQLAYPHWSIVFDFDEGMAATTRRKLLAQLAKEDTLIAGSHVRGIGRIRSKEDGYVLQLIEPGIA
ncbi:MBL fold metallo-hydrolase [Gluconacetobacter tumulicola]|uniref:MBL fold metallo-hydrolase n=1 Tax=Gluconacetobacter tumulicola TaxID=1017177 RepID=A0A7W4P822_9PROT|nr:MBL fold metallo-hydrolase [Gluconacetobacter tumulicola]MBB2180762.1 MBL fold metallo-hydrolase [Gluconacetobacter tumulicola]